MANRLLRSFAVKIGAGLAVGRSLPLVTPQTRRRAPNFTPILTRIEEIESRVTLVELSPQQAAPSPEEIQALGTLVSFQTEDIAGLRQAIQKIENQNAGQAEALERKVASVEQQMPTLIDAAITAKMAELEQRLRGEFQELHHKTIDAFVDTIENRVVGRIAAIETSLVEQAHSIVALREKSVKTDDNLQRLLEAVEKLCVRAEAQVQAQPQTPVQAPVVAPAPPHVDTHSASGPEPQKPVDTFESHLRTALARDVKPPRTVEWVPEPELAFVGAGYSSPRRGMKAVGFAILGLVAIGFRLVR